MAVIAISRQVAALGDEVSNQLAKKLGYEFIDRKAIEKRIVDLGFPKEKLGRYDERKPGFFASLAKDRDEYLDYVQTAVLEAADKGNCILIGRGSFSILANIPNVLTVRFVANDNIRRDRLMAEFDWKEKQAMQRIYESDSNRAGFHKSFFNLDINEPQNFHLVINTGIFTEEEAASIIEATVKANINSEKEKEGSKIISDMLTCQNLVDKLVFEHRLSINFLHAQMVDDVIELHGVADSSVLAEKAVCLASSIITDKEVVSRISVVQDFKSYT
ncbi:MAG: cytidylate kinase-like family protein [Treponemataceae bacterium]|nr:cytidylate kinase-like family protein [Treponemataceae bacterium]